MSATAAWLTWLREYVAKRAGRRVQIPYVWCLEVKRGQDSLPHVHLHMVIQLGWVPFGRCVEAWRRAVGDPGALWHCSRKRRRRTAAAPAPEKAAKYVSKYVTKGSVGLPIELRAEWWAACYARRIVSASRGFWAPSAVPVSRCACGLEHADRDSAWSARCADAPITEGDRGVDWARVLAIAELSTGLPVRSWLHGRIGKPVELSLVDGPSFGAIEIAWGMWGVPRVGGGLSRIG